VLARIVPHALMIVFLISRLITTNQYDKSCVACLWGGVRIESDSPSTGA
jgi:hypothetical protein